MRQWPEWQHGRLRWEGKDRPAGGRWLRIWSRTLQSAGARPGRVSGPNEELAFPPGESPGFLPCRLGQDSKQADSCLGEEKAGVCFSETISWW